jgi:ABC-type transport system involved in cytochrome bd biosynthesis fused ATPase/permease subunit
MRRLLQYALRDRPLILTATATLALLSLAQLYLTWLIKEWVEGPVLGHDGALLRPLLWRAAVAALLGMLSLFVSRATLAAAGQRLLQRLRDDATEALLRAPVKVVTDAATGEWLSRLFNDVNALSGFLSTVARRLITETVILTGAITLMFLLSWRLALALFAVIPIAAWLFTALGRRIRRWGTHAQQATAALTATVNEQLRAFTTVKAYQAEALVAERIHAEGDVLRRRAVRGELWSAALISIVFLLAGAAFLGIFVYGTSHVRLTAAEQASFLAFCLYAGQAIEPARRLGEVHGLLQQSLAASTRVFEVIDLAPEEDAAPAQMTVHTADQTTVQVPSDASVAFERVSFVYGAPLLHDVTFRIGDGEQVAIAGASGCGKTTLTRLLLRFLEPGGGRITLGGVPLVSSNRSHSFSAGRCARTCCSALAPAARTVPSTTPCGWRASAHCRSTRRCARRPAISPAASASASPWHAPSCATRACCCSTRRRAPSTVTPRRPSSRPWEGGCHGGPSSLSPTASPPSAASRACSSSTAAASWLTAIRSGCCTSRLSSAPSSPISSTARASWHDRSCKKLHDVPLLAAPRARDLVRSRFAEACAHRAVGAG